MLELMIAIMILGLGLVMVATVFPVSLDMQRETLQMSISLAAADAAEATVNLRVPSLKDLNNSPSTDWAKMLWARCDLQDDAQIDQYEAEVVNNTPCGFAQRDPLTGLAPWEQWWPPGSEPAQGSAAFLARTRVYTELTGWNADGLPLGSFTSEMVSFVLRGQNIAADYSTSADPLPEEVPARVGDSDQGVPDIRDDFPFAPPLRAGPRMHIADRVYPPIRVGYGFDKDTGAGPQLLNPDTQKALTTLEWQDHVASLAQRRYAWTVIHRRAPLASGQGAFVLSIVVTHRADLTARFARQADPQGRLATDPDYMWFDLADSGDQDKLRQPEADADPTTDTLFPQAWLVMLDTIDPQIGEIQCTPGVAELLPEGSMFVVAYTPGLPADKAQVERGGFGAGTPHKVIGRHWTQGMTGPATLRIGRVNNAGPMQNVAVWVFPPPITRSGTGASFGTHSPVVGIFLREVKAQ